MPLMTNVMEVIAKVMPDRAVDPLIESERLVGQPVDRVDGFEKVTGKARFSTEFAMDDVVYAALAYSTVAAGKILSINCKDAEQAAGVIAVITHLNAPKMKAPPIFDPNGGTDAAGSTTNVLNTDEIQWSGQPIAMVLADSIEAAESAARLVKAEYQTSTAMTSFDDLKDDAEVPPVVMGEPAELHHGDADKALGESSHKVDHTYTTPRYNHNAIELHGTTAKWDADKLTVYTTSQFVRGFADSLAKMFSLKKENVRVIAEFVGGGFGGKGSMWSQTHLCALAAKIVQRPVRLTLSREGVFRTIGGRTPSEQRVVIGADAAGHFKAICHTGITATSTNNFFPEQFTFPVRHLYAADTFMIRQSVVKMNSVANTFMRAPGESIGTFALESAIDEMALELGMDPIELRGVNEPEKDPIKDTPFSSRHLNEVYAVGCEKFGWKKGVRQPRSKREGPWLIGQGVATAFYPVYRYPASCRVKLDFDGSVTVQMAAHEMGMGTATAQSQATADRLGVPMSKVKFQYGRTDFPDSPVAGGSNQTISLAAAVRTACDMLEKDLVKRLHKEGSSVLAKVDADDIEIANGGLRSKKDPTQTESFVSIMKRLGELSIDINASSEAPLEMKKYSMGSYGAQFCKLRVNEETGEVRISRWLGVFDGGTIINPKTAHSQLVGGIIMGIGMALTEETLHDDRSGRIMNPSLAEYHVPVHADIPTIETHCLNIPDPLTPLGAHGIGEIGITGCAAAIANAIYDATGRRIRSLPITLDKLL